MDKNKFDELYGTGDKPSRSYTKADIERIVAIACREQRYKCVDKFSEANPEWQGGAAISI